MHTSADGCERANSGIRLPPGRVPVVVHAGMQDRDGASLTGVNPCESCRASTLPRVVSDAVLTILGGHHSQSKYAVPELMR